MINLTTSISSTCLNLQNEANLSFLLARVFDSLFHSRLVQPVNMDQALPGERLVLQRKVAVANMPNLVLSMEEKDHVEVTSTAMGNTKEKIVNQIPKAEMDKTVEDLQIMRHPSKQLKSTTVF